MELTKLFTLEFVDGSSLWATQDTATNIAFGTVGNSSQVAEVLRKDMFDKIEPNMVCSFAESLSKRSFVKNYVDHVEETSKELEKKLFGL